MCAADGSRLSVRGLRTAARREAGPVALLAAILEGTESLSGAACTRTPELFDPRDPTEDSATAERRHHAAVTLCLSCPVMDTCRAWADASRDQAHSVTAGRAPRPPGRPKNGSDQ